jgi:hypothetical protein
MTYKCGVQNYLEVWNYMAENRDLETMSDRETILRKEDMS